VHEYTVGLTISGDEVDEAEISKLLGMKSSVSFKKGEVLAPRSKRRRSTSTWSFDFDPPVGKPVWPSLEDGLRFMIERLVPKKDVLLELGKRYSMDAYCGHFGSGFGGGPSIAPETLGTLSELGLTLTIKTYWGSTEPE
jgi:hypothetical protein